MSDPASQALLKRIAAARKQGASMEKVLQMTEEFLAAQPKEYAESRREKLLEQVKILHVQATLVEQVAKAKSKEEGKDVILQMYANLQAMETQEERDKKRAKFHAVMEEAQAEGARRNAALGAERKARGLSEKAETGEPGPQVILYEATERVEPIEKKLFKNLNTLREIRAAKLERDRIVLEEMPLGASRVGGLPDLPPGIKWPTYKGKKIPFLAQIDLSSMAADTVLLPADGWLYAFGLFDNEK
jgi:hypothetical protein